MHAYNLMVVEKIPRLAQRYGAAPPMTLPEDMARAPPPRLNGTRLAAVHDAFNTLDKNGVGKINIQVHPHLARYNISPPIWPRKISHLLHGSRSF